MYESNIELVSLPKNCVKAMSSTPNFDEVKEACNSDRLEHCFRFLFMKDLRENDAFISLIDEECDDVRQRMQHRRRLLQEGRAFSPFDPVSGDGLECMRQAQNKDGEILAALMVVLDLAREAREQKHEHVTMMEQYL